MLDPANPIPDWLWWYVGILACVLAAYFAWAIPAALREMRGHD